MPALHVETQGSGSPLLLIHGWGMHGGMWGGVAERLAEHCRVMAVDLPGHGSSARNDECGMMSEEQSVPLVFHSAIRNPQSALDSLVDQLSAQFDTSLAICGWSLGGQVALRWAQRYPQQVSRLILVASTPCFVSQPGWDCALAAKTLEEFAVSLQQNYALTLKRFLALQVRGSKDERELLATLRSALLTHGEPDLVALQAGLEILRDTDMRGSLSGIRQPTLVIGGERDMLTPVQASRHMAEVMPDALLAIIEGAAHAPFLSHPDEFMKHLKNFLYE